MPAPLRRLLTDSSVPPTATGPTQSFELTTLGNDASSVLDVMTPAHAILEPSRYLRDFDELGVLGKGGYGTVYQVKHKLDNVQYAVKVVPISAARMARIRMRGQQEIDDLLLELRTLARLEHPNIVRYFAGWVEWSHARSVAYMSGLSSLYSSDAAPRDWLDEEDAVAGAEDSQALLDRIVIQSSDDGTGIVFERSASQNTDGTSGPSGILRDIGIGTQSEVNPIQSGKGDFVPSTPGPVLALHLQMALYPMTLADFLMPSTTASDKDIAPLTHCFHLQPSLDILMALLDGVEYLHGEDVVHRDLKPANIFMSENHNPRSTRGSVDLLLCSDCRADGNATAKTLNVRIGDFGLVTALAQPELTTEAQVVPVGTEIYRPLATTSDASASLDLFALGIIAFELLWKFDTRG